MSTNKNTAAKISLVVSILVFATKICAYYISLSTAILSDALESIVNVLTAMFALAIVRYAAIPADDDHPYGHGKAEYLSAAFEGGLIFIAAGVIIKEGFSALWEGAKVHDLEWGLLVSGLAALMNFALGTYIRREGMRHSSAALLASGSHILSDVWTSAGVIVALILVRLTGLVWIDPVIGIGLGFWLAKEGFQIVRNSWGGLIDQTDETVLRDLAVVFNRHRLPNTIDIHHLKVIRAGNFHHVDAHLVVPEYINIAEAHTLMDNYAESVVKDYVFDGEIAFHLDPCRRAYCSICQVQSCTVRVAPFQELRPFTEKSLAGDPNPTGEPQY
jgi:cation diffusion facilitator family transporter